MADLRFSRRKAGAFVDIVHVVLGFLIVIMACFAIFDPAKHKQLFPAIFFLASLIYYCTAWFVISEAKATRRKKSGGALYLIIGTLTLAMAVISAISIWGNP